MTMNDEAFAVTGKSLTLLIKEKHQTLLSGAYVTVIVTFSAEA